MDVMGVRMFKNESLFECVLDQPVVPGPSY